MGQFNLNLSTRPFKPYRAANLGLLALLLLLIAVSAEQVYSYQQYSAKAAASRENERKEREQADFLATQVTSYNEKMSKGNAAAKLAEVEQLNQLLVRKSFSWTRLLANLEKVTPDDVRIISLHPVADPEGKIILNMNIRGRTIVDATTFLRALEDSKMFTDVVLAVEEKADPLPMGEVDFTLSAYYSPEPPKAEPPKAQPAKAEPSKAGLPKAPPAKAEPPKAEASRRSK
jgi:Tfp pilus assembly protein PilN